MKKKENSLIEVFIQKMLVFYQENKRDLPWRREGISAYEVWVSEIMLQQTQVSRVVEYYTKFLKRFPDVRSLASASWEEFLPYYEGLGYYRRGRNMLLTAQEVVTKHRGKFPRDITELEKLPGIGAYTARAIASFAWGESVLAWDTNFTRVFGRFFEGSKRADMKAILFEKSLFRYVKQSRDFNASVMDFGSAICTKNPKCDVCPLESRCAYALSSGTKEEHQKKQKEVFPTKEAYAYVILHEEHRRYFSSDKKVFCPFMLPPEEHSREAIKYYFYNTYGLNVSVRPPKIKLYIDEQPTLIIYAQILSGTHDFASFEPKEARAILDTLM